MTDGTSWATLLAATSLAGVVRLLQWLAVALVFLFFLRVMRAVWVEARPAGPRSARYERRRQAREQRRSAAPPSRGRKAPLVLEVVEPLERAGQRFQSDGDVTIGRSPGCGIGTADDIYSSTLHARVFLYRDRLWVEDLGSTNGTYVNSERITKPTKLGRGDLLQVGGTVFEVSR